MAMGRFGNDFQCTAFKHNLRINILNMQVNIALGWMPEGLVDEEWTSVQVMACCRQWPLLLTWFNFDPGMDK